MPSDSQRHDALERATELCVSRGLCVFDSPEAMIEFFDLQDVMRLPLGGAAGIVANLKLKQKREEAARSRRHERRKLRRQQDQRHYSDESTPQTPDDGHDDDDEGVDDHHSPLLRSSTTALVTCDQDEEPKRPHKNSPPSTQTESASQQLCVVDGKDTPYAGGGEDHEDEEVDDATTWWRPYFVSASLPSLRDEELAAVCGAMIPTTTTTATNNILHDPKLFKRGAVVEGPMPFYLSSMWRSANTTTTDSDSTSTCTGKSSQTATSLSNHSSLSTTTGRIVLLPFAFAGAALYVSVTTVANMINTAVVAPVVWSAEKSAGIASWVGEGYRRRWGARNGPFSQGKKCRKKKKAVAHRQTGKRTKNDRTRRGWSQRDEERVLLTKYRVGEVEQLSGWLFDEHEGEEEGGIRTGPRFTSPTSETDEEYSSSCCARTPRSDDEGPNAVDREVLSDQSMSQDGSPLSSVVPALGAMEDLQANGNGFSSHTDDGLASPFSQELLRPCEKWGAKRHQHGHQRGEQQQVKQLVGNSDEDASSSSNSSSSSGTDTDTEDSGADSLVEEETEGKAYRFIGTAPQIYSSSNLPHCCQCRCTCGKEKVTPRKPEVPLESSNKDKMSGTPDTRSGEGVDSASTGKTAELSTAAESAPATKEEGGATVQQGALTSFPSLSTAAGLVSSFAFSVVDVTRKIVDHVAPTQPRHQSNADDTHAKPNAHNSDGYCRKCCRCLPSASACAAANKKGQSTRVSGKGPSEDGGGMGSSHGTEAGRGTNGGVDRVIFIPAMQRLSVKVLDKMLPGLTQQEHGESLLSTVDGSFSAPQSQDTSIEAESSAGGGGGDGDGDRSLAGNVPNILPAFSRVFTLDEWIDLLLSLEIKSGEAVTEHLVLTQHLIVFDVEMVIGVLPNKKRGPKDTTAEKCNTILLESSVRCEQAPQCVNDVSELPSETSPNAASAPSPPSSSCLLASSSDKAPRKDDDTTARVRVRTLKALYFPLPKGFGRGLLSTEQPQGNRLLATGDDDEALSDAKALAAWKYLAQNLSLQVGFWEEALEQALAMSRGLDEEEGTLESSLHQLREQQQHDPDDNIDTNGIGKMTKVKKQAKEISEKLNDIAKTKATVQRDIDVLSRRIAENKLVAIECEKLRNRLSSSSSSSSSRPVSLREAVVRVEELMHNFGDGPWPRL